MALDEGNEKLTNADRIERFLTENPWKTQKEIAEGTGIKISIIGATMYAKPNLGRFTSKKDPKNSRGKIWANGEPGKPSFVGGKPFASRKKRRSSTDLVFDWLRENGAASVTEIVAGISGEAQTKSADLRTVVRTIVSRAADDGSLIANRDSSTNLYWVPGFEQPISIDDAKPGTALSEIRDCFYSNNNEFLTVNQLIEYTGRTMNGIRDVIYHPKYKHLFDRRSREGSGNQTLFRLKKGAMR
ncbi:hypothetical protein RBWH47_05608 [Rhodopirellula baltica WH47]|uniref:Uncharacterized protein n=1 Tax=Rhodopirellula baltica WH47 TaxID=991778 RepID=F2ATH8_RHOBT|nr:hypothetical protein RBWH47_05608 [Rhodopirellula baltica WH47]